MHIYIVTIACCTVWDSLSALLYRKHSGFGHHYFGVSSKQCTTQWVGGDFAYSQCVRSSSSSGEHIFREFSFRDHSFWNQPQSSLRLKKKTKKTLPSLRPPPPPPNTPFPLLPKSKLFSTELPSRLTRHWTSGLCLAPAAKVSRCLFRVGFQALIYAGDDNAALLQESGGRVNN